MKQVFPKPFVVVFAANETVDTFDTIEEAYKAGEAANGDYYLAKAIDVHVETQVTVTEVDPSFAAAPADAETTAEEAGETPAEEASEPVNE